MPVQNKEQIFQMLATPDHALRQLGVRQIGLFGSFVRGQQRNESDVDMLVAFMPGQKTFDNFMRLALLLEEVLGRSVDVLTPDHQYHYQMRVENSRCVSKYGR